MKKRNPDIRVGLKVAAVLAALLFLLPTGEAGAIGLEEGDEAAAFTGTDLLGNTVDITPLIGKQIIILKFGSIYCSSCVKSISNLAELQKKYPEDEVKVVGINLDIYGVFRVKRFYRGYRQLVNYPVVIDENLNVSRKYGVATLPSIVIIDREGRIARKMVGYQEAELASIMDFAERLAAAKDVTELAGLLPTKEKPVNLFFPTNFTKTKQDSIYVIGAVSKVGSKVQLTLNGGSRQEMTTDREFFYFRTPVSLGSNYIEVSLLEDGRKRQSQAVVLFRDPKIGAEFQTQFPTYNFHLEENEKECLECHELTPPESSDQNFMMVTQICLECHIELSQKDFVHGPITVGGCSPCHDFASQPERYNLFTTGTELCYTCHEEKRQEFARSYIHGPLAAGVCSVCHSPHGSNERFQLRLPQGQMCTLCHQQIREVGFRTTLHSPFGEGNCSGCHNPHSSTNPNFFLHQSGEDLCFLCHDELEMEGHRHPVGTVPLYTYPGIKLTEEGETVCASCHNAHATDSEYLLPENGCAACHSY